MSSFSLLLLLKNLMASLACRHTESRQGPDAIENSMVLLNYVLSLEVKEERLLTETIPFSPFRKDLH
jgi:hypothetical protein